MTEHTEHTEQQQSSRLTQITAMYAGRDETPVTLRRQLDELDANIHDMQQTLFRFVERFGWEHLKVEQLDAEIGRWLEEAQRISARLRALTATAQSQPEPRRTA